MVKIFELRVDVVAVGYVKGGVEIIIGGSTDGVTRFHFHNPDYHPQVIGIDGKCTIGVPGISSYDGQCLYLGSMQDPCVSVDVPLGTTIKFLRGSCVTMSQASSLTNDTSLPSRKYSELIQSW